MCRFLTTLGVFCVLSFGAHADCVKAMLAGDFWASTKPYMVTVQGQQHPITFSFDSEVPESGFLHLIPKIPELKTLADDAYEGQVIDLATMTKRLKMSEAQVRAFVLKRSVPKDRAAFTYDELNTKYISRFFVAEKSVLYRYAEFWKYYMADRNIPFDAHVDEPVVEFTHATYADVPVDFKKLMDSFNALFTKRNTHFHVGIPAAIGEERSIAIARAIETMVTLAFMENWPDQKQYVVYHSGSTISDDPGVNQDRGFIGYHFGEWTKPHDTSNIEIRQWQSQYQAFSWMQLAAELAKNHERLRLIDWTLLIYDKDPNVGNGAGALAYAGEILRLSKSIEDQKLGADLLVLARKVVVNRLSDYHRQVSQSMRVEVAEFLTRNRVRQRLSLAKFLKD